MLIRAFEEGNRARPRGWKRRPAPAPRSARKPRPSASSPRWGRATCILTNHRSAGHLIARGADPGRMIAEIMGKRTRLLQGQERHAAHLGQGARRHPDLDDRRRRAVARARRRAGAEDAARRSRRIVAVLLRRRRRLRRHLPRVGQPGRRLEPADPLSCARTTSGRPSCTARDDAASSTSARWARRATASTAVTVDGNDVEAVHARRARRRCARSATDDEPCLLETFTYRLRGHFEPDDQAYVDPAELAALDAPGSDRSPDATGCSTREALIAPRRARRDLQQRVARDRRQPPPQFARELAVRPIATRSSIHRRLRLRTA